LGFYLAKASQWSWPDTGGPEGDMNVGGMTQPILLWGGGSGKDVMIPFPNPFQIITVEKSRLSIRRVGELALLLKGSSI